MKKIRLTISLVSLFLVSTLIQSCNTDDDNTSYYAQLGTVSKTANTESSWIIKGDTYGNSLITNSQALIQTGTDSIGQRILCYFTCDNDNDMNNITLYNVYKVLTKKIDIVDDATDVNTEFGNNTINIVGANASDEHLNIYFEIQGYNVGAKHRISLVGLESSLPDKDGNINLQLCHNAFDDQQIENRNGYVSYTLESIPGFTDGTLKSVSISYKKNENESGTFKVKLKEKKSLKSTTFSSNMNSAHLQMIN